MAATRTPPVLLVLFLISFVALSQSRCSVYDDSESPAPAMAPEAGPPAPGMVPVGAPAYVPVPAPAPAPQAGNNTCYAVTGGGAYLIECLPPQSCCGGSQGICHPACGATKCCAVFDTTTTCCGDVCCKTSDCVDNVCSSARR